MPSDPSRDKVTKATIKMMRHIGDAFREWAKAVGARELANEAADKFKEGIDIVRKGAEQYGPRSRKKKKTKSSARGKKSSAKKRSTKRKSTRKKSSGGKKRTSKKKSS